MKTKPIVKYIGNAITFDGFTASLYALDHPRLGRCKVRTSRIVSQKEDGTIETLNTIYVKVPDEDSSN